MQSLFIFTALLLVAGISAEHNQEVSNVQTGTGPQVDQSSHAAGHSSAFESGPQQAFGTPHHHQHQSVFTSGPSAGFEPGQPMAAHYYSPAGMVQVVGGQQQQSAVVGEQQPGAYKPTGTIQTVRHYSAGSVAPTGAEQYGQPEAAGVPPNYKPFGSWGLYIGGNPADGYYTNYYKALSGSVADKQQAGDQATAVAPATRGAVSGPQTFTSNFGPAGVASPQMKQGPFYPSNQAVSYQDQSYQGYPYGEYYTPAELNSGSRVTVQSVPSTYSSASSYSSGVSGQSPVSPASFAFEEPTGAAMFYAGGGDFGGKKSTGPVAFAQREVHVPASPAKGFHQTQQRTYYAGYQQQQAPQQASGASSFEAPAPSGVAHQQYQQQQSAYQAAPAPQVVAYPVPVGSQIVGSQPGVDGAFQPYGVHAFTRYAVKPTVVSSEQSTYYQTGAHSPVQFPVYRQYYSYPQPLGFYGYPLSQLHYSSGVAAFAPSQSVPGQAAPGSPATVAQQQQQQQQHAAAVAAVAAANAPHPGPEPAPAQAPAPGQGPAPAQGATVVVEHSGPGPVGSVHAPVAFFEAASSEKSETTQKESVSDKKAKPSQQQQKSN